MKSDCKSLDIKRIQYLLDQERKKRYETISQINYSTLKKAAILIPFVCVDGCWSLLFTRRADSLKNHRGQVSFPGGGMDKQDATPTETALREANEEIGLKKTGIHIIGLMPDFMTNSNYMVTPVVSWVDWPVPLEISNHEVSRVFTIPVDWLKNSNNWEERLFSHPNGLYGTVIFYNLYDGELLWGISAKITIDLLNILD
ncbi:MAG: CoA pyrophosphatase [Chloroflexi bacterium HGW-Chloroflexi-3]|nr:MAG: CoA pyrophosphatase [Chloroflexi bacterium HGW-Chloroflexi-3]